MPIIGPFVCEIDMLRFQIFEKANVLLLSKTKARILRVKIMELY